MSAVLGQFPHADDLLKAAERMKQSGFGITVFSPIPLVHEMEEVFGEERDYLRFFTLFGGVAGFMLGVILSLGTAVLYVLPRGGRPILTAPPTLLIAYETMILLGVCMTLLGFFVIAGIPCFRHKVDEPACAMDSFGLLVKGVGEGEIERVNSILMESGANEVKNVEDD
ncbi:MAG: DUF3341 domain-containing protein [Deltaproteobacteria bacterium]|nr:DUF3341 domain-containing protein [Deltaproteobacteria bacterium]